jgi:hypothetical protein
MVLQMGANGASCQELQITPKNRFRTNFFWIRGNCIIFYHLLSIMCSHSSFVQVCNLLVFRVNTKTHPIDELDSNLGPHFSVLVLLVSLCLGEVYVVVLVITQHSDFRFFVVASP